MGAIRVRSLVKRYKKLEALRGIDLDVECGQIFGLLGPNGAGKTTLISVIASLRPFEGGVVEVCGYELPRHSQRVRECLGIVPQSLALYDAFTAWQNLAYFGSLYGLPRKLLNERIRDALEIVGLTERARERVRTFSGGMRRRLNVAAGLLHRPQLLLLDEPTVGVDPHSRNRIFEAIRQLNRQTGMTILYTTHYMEEAEELCDQVAIIDHGVVVANGPVHQLLRMIGPSVVRIQFEQGAPSLSGELTDYSCFSSVSGSNGALEVSTEVPEEALSVLLRVAREKELRVRDIQVREPSLAEVFLRLTGKELRD